MSKKHGKKTVKNLIDGVICANECTGALVTLSVDGEELESFRRQFNGQSKGKRKK